MKKGSLLIIFSQVLSAEEKKASNIRLIDDCSESCNGFFNCLLEGLFQNPQMSDRRIIAPPLPPFCLSNALENIPFYLQTP